MQCANKTRISSVGTKTLKVDIGLGEMKHTFQCFENITEQILGRDFCEANNIVINFKNQKITREEIENDGEANKIQTDDRVNTS